MAAGLVGCAGAKSPHAPTGTSAAVHADAPGDPGGSRLLSAAADEPSAPASPQAVVARVGPYPITGAIFNRAAEAALRGEPSSERLSPPQFSACVSSLRSEAEAGGEHAPSATQLRGECKKRYQVVLQGVLERLISSEWRIGGAHELGASIDETAPLEVRAKLAANAIRRAIRSHIARITRAQIVSYYHQHKYQYLLTAKRDLKIARSTTEAEAAKVRSEIASGKSIASVVSKLPAQQPFNSVDGLVLELQPHVYGEPNLNEAIFNARQGVLVGPIDTWFGYFVFEVTKIGSERVQPLADVEAAIRQSFSSPLEQRALAAFTKHWNTTWTTQTDCSPGYVVPKCRQFTGAPVSPPEASELG